MPSCTLPDTPGRGRSRFSKVLPSPPRTTGVSRSPKLFATSLESPLPPLPRGEELPSKAAISRKPVAVTDSAAAWHSSASDSSASPGHSKSDSSSDVDKDSLSGVDSEIGPSPIASSRTTEGEVRVGLPETPLENWSNSAANFTPSPPRTEIWRRRSEKSDRSIVVTGLKLGKSNGSTANPTKEREASTSSDRVNLPRSLGGRKPVPARLAPPQPQTQTDSSSMGNKLGKEKKSLEGLTSTAIHHEATNRSYPLFQQLSTPEYLKSEKRERSVASPISLLSPFTRSEAKTESVPSKPESRGTASAAASKSSEASTSSESTTRPTPLSPHSRHTSDTPTIKSDPAPPPLQEPTTPAGIQISSPSHPKTPHTRTSSHATDLTILPSPVDDGTIYPGPPLDVTHLECFHFHKHMRTTNNRACPVACMICEKEDTETRWRCTWCCLSACAACMQVLTSIPGKDLKQCLRRLGR